MPGTPQGPQEHEKPEPDRYTGACLILIRGGHDDNLILLKGNPLYCNCYIRPLRKWAKVSGVRLLGACAGPAHLADEPLEAVALLNLRCRSRGEVLKDDFEKADESAEEAPPTAKPKHKVKCPVNCHCNVRHFWKVCLSLWSCFLLLSTSLHPALAPCLIRQLTRSHFVSEP